MKMILFNILFLLVACGQEVADSSVRSQLTIEAEHPHYLQQSIESTSAPSEYVTTQGKLQYPLVLHHGLMGGVKIGSFGDMKSLFEGQDIEVFKTEVSPANSIAIRAHQLAPQIEEILAKTGSGKVNIIAHSMGGLDARYLISTLGFGDRIASLTTIATPHYGTPVANLADRLSPHYNGRFVNKLVTLLGSIMNESSREMPSDLKAALHDLTEDYVSNTFNPNNPDDPRVYYQSYAGITGLRNGDVTSPLLKLSRAYLKRQSGLNDGMVPLSSAQWGNFRATLSADHIDLAGHVHLIPRPFAIDFKAFFQDVVEDLGNLGF